ncbi:hypothetical protein [Histidinibacterium aquaticum]|uniref:Uncharacterized protein n=1 Tax=Histidinibacterium aquaticum TaxID=2613962 RepID=A0A5J5GEP7_9RHOB|nr:hypothetical protein [Histidinibacterium aquaticum]KAA9006699.1 hypothetical protein F3S47_13015 [Histidinibacterium aquaticum]
MLSDLGLSDEEISRYFRVETERVVSVRRKSRAGRGLRSLPGKALLDRIRGVEGPHSQNRAEMRGD